jgi:prevent-host-death family protein
MVRVGIRELRQQASALLRRVAAGEIVEVSDRGRPVAVITRAGPRGLAKLEDEGLLRRGEGELLAVTPLRRPPGVRPPSERVIEDRSA